MGTFGKIALTIIVIAAVAFGIWSYRQRVEAPEATGPDATPALSTGSTDQDLDQDLKTIDGQLDIINQSSTEIDTSLGGK